jgi:hypothetical protein
VRREESRGLILQASTDGGPGFDMAFIGPFVRVSNVELVFHVS